MKGDTGAGSAVLVTGSAGFIGYHTARALLDRGYEVVGVDNLNTYYDVRLKGRRNERLIRHSPLYHFYEADVADYERIKDITKGHSIGHIVHLAAQAGVRYSIENPWLYAHSNYLGTLSVFELARHLKVPRVVYASSSSVYGDSAQSPFSEDDVTLTPRSFYGSTKIANEALAYSYGSLYGIEHIGLRFFTVYGEWGRPDMSPIIFSKAILSGRPISLFNNGEMMRDFTYVGDIVSGIVAAMETRGVPSGPYNLGAGSPVPIGAFVELLEKNFNTKANIQHTPMQAGDMVRTYADCSKSRAAFAYRPAVSLEDGVRRFTDWFLAERAFFDC